MDYEPEAGDGDAIGIMARWQGVDGAPGLALHEPVWEDRLIGVSLDEPVPFRTR